MAKKKQQDTINYKKILGNRKVPILTLDARWHELFPEHEKTSTMKELENQLNKLLQQQGKLVTDAKDMKVLKRKLMDEIVANMGEENGIVSKLKIRKQQKSQQLILDINRKLEDSNEFLLSIPYEIQEVNQALLIESMKVCYEKFRLNKEDINQIEEWIERAREELKRRILVKQDKEMQNDAMYSYLHNLLGADVMNIFDERNI